MDPKQDERSSTKSLATSQNGAYRIEPQHEVISQFGICFVSLTARRPCEQCSSDPPGSRVWPLTKSAGWRHTRPPPLGCQRIMRFFGISLHSTLPSYCIQTGP